MERENKEVIINRLKARIQQLETEKAVYRKINEQQVQHIRHLEAVARKSADL